MFMLGIVSKENAANGIFNPSYLLIKALHPQSGTFEVINMNNIINIHVDPIIVNSIEGKETLVRKIASAFDYDEDGKIYYIDGYVFWFSCNEYGIRDGPVIFAAKTQLTKRILFKEIEDAHAESISTKNILSKDNSCISMIESHKKATLVQNTSRTPEKQTQKFQDIIGKKFGLLTVKYRVKDTKDYICECECGNIARYKYNSLIRNRCSSCGCYGKRLEWNNI